VPGFEFSIFGSRFAFCRRDGGLEFRATHAICGRRGIHCEIGDAWENDAAKASTIHSLRKRGDNEKNLI
jgi:hypothetical protein